AEAEARPPAPSILGPEQRISWPDIWLQESAPVMVVLAREDIDEAVHAILFRENYVVKVNAVPPFCGPLLRRQQKAEEEVRASHRYETGKQYFAKELKETKDRLHTKWPPFIFTLQNVIPKESQKASGVPRKSKAFSPERPICMEKKRLFGKEKTTDLSQLAFERQFPFSQLRKSKEAEKKGLVSETWGRAWLAGFGSIPKTDHLLSPV
uniref:Uncharacterized protein n=1 Tax=Marmota marmota marmota TaxID=9994 RepID=A0A8C6A5E4_MARMA